MGADEPARLTRRALLRGTGAIGLAAFVPGGFGRPGRAFAVDLDGPTFLTEAERGTLAALVDRFVPGPPEDLDPGAAEAGCADAIDALLAAFDVDPPRIFAGAPFSDRGGSPVNHFVDFLPLDGYEARAWRLRIHGSEGDPDLEVNGPVTGWRTIYRDGLAALDAAAPGGDFAALPFPLQEVVLRSGDPPIDRLVDVAFPHTLEFMYGAPEYGGNRDLIAWEYTNFDGDVQPRGYTRDEVENPDEPGLPELLDLDLPGGLLPAEVARMSALGTAEVTNQLLSRGRGLLSGMQAEVAPTRATPRLLGATDEQVAAAVAAVARVVRGEATDA